MEKKDENVQLKEIYLIEKDSIQKLFNEKKLNEFKIFKFLKLILRMKETEFNKKFNAVRNTILMSLKNNFNTKSILLIKFYVIPLESLKIRVHSRESKKD